MPPVEFETTISAGERPQTYVLDLTATGTGTVLCTLHKYTVCNYIYINYKLNNFHIIIILVTQMELQSSIGYSMCLSCRP